MFFLLSQLYFTKLYFIKLHYSKLYISTVYFCEVYLLSFESLFLAEELEASTKKQEKKTKIPAGLGFALTSAINEMKTGKK